MHCSVVLVDGTLVMLVDTDVLVDAVLVVLVFGVSDGIGGGVGAGVRTKSL